MTPWRTGYINPEQHFFKQTDLHHRRRTNRALVYNVNRRLLTIIALTVATAAGSLVPMTVKLSDNKRTMQEAAKQENSVSKQLDTLNAQKSKLDGSLSHWQKFSESQKHRTTWPNMVEETANLLPQSAFLDTLDIDKSNGATKIVLDGSSETADALQKYVSGINHSTILETVRLSEVTRNPSLGPFGIRFKIEGGQGKPEPPAKQENKDGH